MRGRIFTSAVLLCLSTAAAADEQPICATRPGKSTAPCTTPAGHFQIETGLVDWSLQKSGGERDTSLAIGETTFKYGLTDRSDIGRVEVSSLFNEPVYIPKTVPASPAPTPRA